ncbi:MAG: 16S rRNA (adenine(1518)-N(6)/adenine(1519)-N(6))-dimethyltransferase RsmA [Candidatus Omnitrophota bacterium]
MLKERELAHTLRELNIQPKKRLGQNFLIDKNIQQKILRALDLKKDEPVLEIGPGLGALTWDICENAKEVTAIEKDKRCYDYLVKQNSYENLTLINADVLKYEFTKKYKRSKVVGNLPYYITTPIISHLIENRSHVASLYISIQKEVAKRLTASAGSKDYGAISCFVQFYTKPRILFNIKKGCFLPAPKVESSFLELNFYEEPLYLTNEEKLFKIIRICFNKRRKTILNALSSSGEFGSKEEVAEALKSAGIVDRSRPEEIPLEGFVSLVDILHNIKN